MRVKVTAQLITWAPHQLRNSIDFSLGINELLFHLLISIRILFFLASLIFQIDDFLYR